MVTILNSSPGPRPSEPVKERIIITNRTDALLVFSLILRSFPRPPGPMLTVTKKKDDNKKLVKVMISEFAVKPYWEPCGPKTMIERGVTYSGHPSTTSP